MANITDHQNSDGVRRERRYAALIYGAVGRERDEALEGYLDAPRPANDNRRVYRSVRSPRPYDNICSTRFRYVDVSLPRVTMIDGRYGADNDNRRAA
jgi:hypothetical protein